MIPINMAQSKEEVHNNGDMPGNPFPATFVTGGKELVVMEEDSDRRNNKNEHFESNFRQVIESSKSDDILKIATNDNEMTINNMSMSFTIDKSDNVDNPEAAKVLPSRSNYFGNNNNIIINNTRTGSVKNKVEWPECHDYGFISPSFSNIINVPSSSSQQHHKQISSSSMNYSSGNGVVHNTFELPETSFLENHPKLTEWVDLSGSSAVPTFANVSSSSTSNQAVSTQRNTFIGTHNIESTASIPHVNKKSFDEGETSSMTNNPPPPSIPVFDHILFLPPSKLKDTKEPVLPSNYLTREEEEAQALQEQLKTRRKRKRPENSKVSTNNTVEEEKFEIGRYGRIRKIPKRYADYVTCNSDDEDSSSSDDSIDENGYGDLDDDGLYDVMDDEVTVSSQDSLPEYRDVAIEGAGTTHKHKLAGTKSRKGRNIRSDTWNRKIELLKRFKAEHGHTKLVNQMFVELLFQS